MVLLDHGANITHVHVDKEINCSTTATDPLANLILNVIMEPSDKSVLFATMVEKFNMLSQTEGLNFDINNYWKFVQRSIHQHQMFEAMISTGADETKYQQLQLK